MDITAVDQVFDPSATQRRRSAQSASPSSQDLLTPTGVALSFPTYEHLLPYRTEITSLMQAAVNVRLAEEWLAIVKDLETLQRFCTVQDQAILGIVVLLVKARGVA